jgi:predicted dehydrogenase
MLLQQYATGNSTKEHPMANPLRIGLIGASAKGGWARESHVPAILGTSGMTLEAVATSHQASADEAAHAFGARRAFGDAKAMIHSPEIDVVAVSVRVPIHRELVVAALDAGKHVLSEWPLGTDVDDAAVMASAAQRTVKHVAIGLQARFSPAVQAARDLLATGRIGRVLSVRVLSTTIALSPNVREDAAYMEEPATGVTVYSIHGGHTFDLVEALLGPIAEATVQLSTLYPEIILPNGTRATRRVPEHALFTGRLANKAPFSVEVAGAREGHWPFEFEVIGTEGSLVLRGGGPRGFQATRLSLCVNGLEVTMPASELPDAALNVAGVYAALRDDILGQTHRAPGFGHALALTTALAAMASGQRARYQTS